MSFFRLLSNVFLRTSAFRQNAEEVDTGRPSRHCVEVWARSVHSGARGRCSNFFPAGVDMSISRGFFMRPDLLSYVRAYVFFFLLRSTAQSPDKADNSTMQRACLYPQLTTKLQQAAPCACGRCALACCFYRSLRSITPPHHHLCRCCCLLYLIVSNEPSPEPRQQIITVSCREHVYTPG